MNKVRYGKHLELMEGMMIDTGLKDKVVLITGANNPLGIINLSTDAAKRQSLLTEAAKMIMDDYPMLPLLQYTVPRLVKSYVGGYTSTNSLDRYRAKDFYIIKH